LVTALSGRGWAVHFAQKRGKPDGCAIVMRDSIVTEGVRAIVFGDGAPDRADSGHVALLASVRIAGAELGIATTHLRWDPPGTPTDARWAVREAAELLAAVRATPQPWIVCGDLNIEPDDEVYEMLIGAGLVDPTADNPTPTANPHRRAKRIDHLLCSRDLNGEPRPGLAIDHATPLPSPTMPSDHVPITARFTWTPP
jgi:endonuclease/exonuclease/phosphatase family metal-dependent hydrolase